MDSAAHTFRIYGGVEADAPAGETISPPDHEFLKIKPKGAATLHASRAAKPGAPVEWLDVPDNDVMELVFDDGVHLWITAEEYRKTFAGKKKRGEPDDAVNVHPQLSLDTPTRGVVGLVLKTLKWFGVDLVGHGVKNIAHLVEKQLEGESGVYQLSPEGELIHPKLEVIPSASDPTLIFIHSTATSTEASFGALWKAEHVDLRDRLFGHYKNRIFAFEHKTLTRDPVDNALALAEALPKEGEIHLVTHSRGGLVGELICRGSGTGEPFSSAELLHFKKASKKRLEELQSAFEKLKSKLQPYHNPGEPEEAPWEKLAALNAILSDKKITVSRFVRVACPARGTTLASGRLDRWLNVMVNVLGKVPGMDQIPAYGDIQALLLAVVKTRTDPRFLPGLEAQMPESPLIGLLNTPKSRSGADLSVISGDIEPDNFFKKLMLLMPDAFYSGDHDLIVNTLSMTGGTPRTRQALNYFAQGPNIHHFNYFSHPSTVGKMVQRLTSEKLDGFVPYTMESLPIPRGGKAVWATSLANDPSRQTGSPDPIEVQVVHGDLVYANYPVAVGHYDGDMIASAEAALDRQLKGRLSRRHQLGVYPGKLETSEVVLRLNRQGILQGALVVGLGVFGELIPSKLERSFRRAVVRYALETDEKRRSEQDKLAPWQKRDRRVEDGVSMGISALLVGTGTGGIPLKDSLAAMLQAVIHANRELAATYPDGRLRIAKVQIVERWKATAIQAARLLIREFKCGAIQPADQLKSIPGGHHRIDPPEDPSWWHRMMIQANEQGDLSFNLISGRARTEVSLIAPDRQAVDNYVEDIIDDPRYGIHQDVPATLFELMIPNPIKERTPDGDRLVLNLDEHSARYPWEMLTDRLDQDGVLGATRTGGFTSRGNWKPLAIKKRIIRQLATHAFRRHPNMARNNQALVVGDPKSNFTPLPGARDEAKAVVQAFKGYDLETTSLIGAQARRIMTALFSQDYRILHFAAHGVYKHPVSGEEKICDHCGQSLGTSAGEVTGMVIGQQRFLQPATVEQIRYVPELVFLNCCHLGRIEGARSVVENKHNAYHKIAANLATQFIRMGTRAVIAAGWAVDDAAAKTFASEFYTAFLSGRKTFGEAVYDARLSTYTSHPYVNTFGAYQCYGDPDHVWADPPSEEAEKEARHYVSPMEIGHELDNLTASAKTAGWDDLKWMTDETEEIHEASRDLWPKESSVKAAFGRAWGEMRRFSKAIEAYREATAGEKGAVTLTDIEQLANLESRYALYLLGQDRKETTLSGKSTTPRDLLSSSLKRLDHLMKFGETVERLSLVGSTYKRMATMAATTDSRKTALKKMAANYEKAHLRYKDANNAVNPYPALNWLTAEFFINWYDMKDPKKNGAQLLDRSKIILLNKIVKDSKNRFEIEPNFWGSVEIADGILTQQLARFKLADRKTQEIIDLYLDAQHRASSPREFQSVLDHFEFLVTMAKNKPKPTAQDQTITDDLHHISETLNEETTP